MKLTGKLMILLTGVLLFGFSLNGISASKHKITKRKYPVIKIKRKAIHSQKFKCSKKEYTVNLRVEKLIFLKLYQKEHAL